MLVGRRLVFQFSDDVNAKNVDGFKGDSTGRYDDDGARLFI